MFIIYNLGILCIEYVQVHIQTETHVVRVHLPLRFLGLEGLHFANSQSALEMISLVSFTVCKSMFSQFCTASFSSFRHFAFAVQIPFKSPGHPTAFIVLLFPLPEENDPDMLLSLRSKNVLPVAFYYSWPDFRFNTVLVDLV